MRVMAIGAVNIGNLIMCRIPCNHSLVMTVETKSSSFSEKEFSLCRHVRVVTGGTITSCSRTMDDIINVVIVLVAAVAQVRLGHDHLTLRILIMTAGAIVLAVWIVVV